MRKILIVLGFMLCVKLNAQRYMDYDTIHRNEFSVSFQPVLSLFMSENNSGRLVNFQIGYRHYFKNKVVLRAAFLLFPDNSNGNNYYGLNLYDRTIDSVNVFRTQYNKNGLKTQLNMGLEKIFKVNRLMHGVGFEIFVNHQYVGYNDVYTWYDRKQHVGTIVSGLYPDPNASYNVVDSLGGNYRGTQVGGGLQLFYSLRYKISRHWYFSGTIGPSVNYSVLNANFFDKRTRSTLHTRSSNMDFPAMPLISDVSLCFRF
jgi:hypothetical protein